MKITFKENAHTTYCQIPSWVEGMIQFGYRWTNDENIDFVKKRRLSIISMPCKSVAAPLVALGALRKELEYGHVSNFDQLVSSISSVRHSTEDIILVDQYGKKWKLLKVNCDRSISVYDAKYRKYIKRQGKTVPNPNGIVSSVILEQYLYGWRIEGLPPVLSYNALDSYFYNNLMDCHGLINESSLQTSLDKTLLLSDTVSQSAQVRRELDDVLFSYAEREVSLSELLTVNRSNNKIQRLVFSGSRSLNNTNFTNVPSQVIADGTHCFLLALERFRNSDVIGVISRDEPIDNIEVISNKMNELSRYYQVIDGFEHSFMNINFPLSICMRFLERR